MIRLALFMLLTACITETTHATTNVAVRWTIAELATGLAIGCPAGFEIARFIARPQDATGAAIVTDFPCIDGVGISAALDQVPYAVTIEIRAEDGTVYAASVPAGVDLTNGNDQSVAMTILTDAGYAHVTWNLVDALGAQVSCARVDHIVVAATAGATTYTDAFPCELHAGLTNALPAGDYAFSVTAQRFAHSIGSTPLTHQPIEDKNRITDLGAVQVAITDP